MDNYISVIAAIVAFIVTALVAIPFIPFLKKLKYGQTILEDGPKWHKSKEGTPTMGGIIIILGVLSGIAVAISASLFGGDKLSSEFSMSIRPLTLFAGLIFALFCAVI